MEYSNNSSGFLQFCVSLVNYSLLPISKKGIFPALFCCSFNNTGCICYYNVSNGWNN